MGFRQQVGLLLWKQLILLRRRWCFIFFDLFLPLLTLAIFLVIYVFVPNNKPRDGQNASHPIKTHHFDSVPLRGDWNDLDHEVKSINRISMHWFCTNSTNYKQYNASLAYSYEPGLQNDANSLMEQVTSGYFMGTEDKVLPYHFDNRENMERELRKDLRNSYEECHKFIGGIHFSDIKYRTSNDEPKLVYEILLPASTRNPSWNKEQFSEFWQEGGPSEPQSDHNQIRSEPGYWKSGFLSLQYAVAKHFIKKNNEGMDTMDYDGIRLKRMPFYEFEAISGPIIWVGRLFPFFLFIICFYIPIQMVIDITTERIAGIMTYMSVMGLHPLAFYAAHFLYTLIKMSFIVGIVAAVVAILIFEPINAFLLILLCVLLCFSVLVMVLFLTTLFKHRVLAQLIPLLYLAICALVPIFVNLRNKGIGIYLLASLDPFFAFEFGFQLIVQTEKANQVGWSILYANSHTHNPLTLGIVFLMLLLDFTLFALLACYLITCFPAEGASGRHPLFFLKFCGIKRFDNKEEYELVQMGVDQMDSATQNPNIEPEDVDGGDEADIVVRGMSKKWSTSGQLAVDNLSFKALRGHITVLLGHNGAGKSTTFSVLTGAVDYSAGQVFICGADLKRKLRQCQKWMGYCPQYNPLIGRLTAREHLLLFAGMKSGKCNGPDGKAKLEQEIDNLAENLHIELLLDKNANSLSGGQKRKLCVAISLVAESRVVLLDEPTAGMDPEARNKLSQFLQSVKNDRTILLTTHYMEEADAMGDRIGIMVKGRLACYGSSEFLKNRFGAGYILTMVCTDSTKDGPAARNHFDDKIAVILSVIRKHSPNAHIDPAHNPPEFSVILPISDKKHYANLFKELENRSDQLGISSFGLSINSLEQVFLKVGELADPDEEDRNGVDMADGKGANKYAQELFGVRQQQFLKTPLNLIRLFCCQLMVMVYRHLLWALRNPFSFFGCLLIALLLAAASFGIALLIHPDYDTLSRSTDPRTTGEHMSIPLQFKTNKYSASIDRLTSEIPGITKILFPPNSNLSEQLLHHLNDQPPMVIGVRTANNNGYNGVVIDALFNGIAYHSAPMAVTLVINALLGGKSFDIQPSIMLYDIPLQQRLAKDEEQPIPAKERRADPAHLAMLVVLKFFFLAFAFFPCFLVMPLVVERASCFKHQLLLTRLHSITYWLSVLVWNALVYLVFCSAIMTTFYILGWMIGYRSHICLVWFLYFWSFLPIISCASFLFSRPFHALLILLLFNVLIVPFITQILLLLTAIKILPEFMANLYEIIIYTLLPSVGISTGHDKIGLMLTLQQPLNIMHEHYLRSCVLGMFFSGILYWVLLFLLQSRLLRRKSPSIGPIRRFVTDQNQDEDVREECERMKSYRSEEYALCVNNLSKYFGRAAAVDNITFGVGREQCFGLLGVNGAGKTTTFNILTGFEFASTGRATIGGIDVSKSPPIGYCPQVDALPMELTGREVLTLLARLNGFSNVKRRVDQILWCVRMEREADKLIQYYSGGQRRRISIGLTLITRSKLIMLDEPTAGIDPKTRREIWNLLQAIRRQHIAILLTSHSMEECEALCNRIAFMNRGRLVGIGTSQHLKTRFGTGYLLSITVSNPVLKVRDYLDRIVIEQFAAKPTQDPANFSTYRWEFPKQEGISWSELYKRVQDLADTYAENVSDPDSDRPKIVDFSLTQNSLEQVFLNLSRQYDDVVVVKKPKKTKKGGGEILV